MESVLSENAVAVINSLIFGYTLVTITVHWVCDFVLQKSSLDTDTETDYKRNHCLCYAVTFPVLTAPLAWLAGCTFQAYFAFVLLCVASHTLVDYGLIPVLFKCKEVMSLRLLGLAWALDQVIHIFFILTGLILFVI